MYDARNHLLPSLLPFIFIAGKWRGGLILQSSRAMDFKLLVKLKGAAGCPLGCHYVPVHKVRHWAHLGSWGWGGGCQKWAMIIVFSLFYMKPNLSSQSFGAASVGTAAPKLPPLHPYGQCSSCGRDLWRKGICPLPLGKVLGWQQASSSSKLVKTLK